jgi:alkyl hydroperoxide reductase subunit D
MKHLDALRERLPEYARDLRLNLVSVLTESSLTAAQRWGVAVAAAAASRHHELLEAIVSDARAEAGESTIDDALAASSLMAMNNIFYRFRHMVGKESYGQLPARLRMNRLARPATHRGDLELFSLAASAVHGCEACVRSHERAVLESGLSEQNVHDAVRIAAVVHGVAVTLVQVSREG